MDQLHLHYTSAIHNAAFQIVLGYVELCSRSQQTKYNRLQYADLCKVSYGQLHLHYTSAIHNAAFQIVLDMLSCAHDLNKPNIIDFNMLIYVR